MHAFKIIFNFNKYLSICQIVAKWSLDYFIVSLLQNRHRIFQCIPSCFSADYLDCRNISLPSCTTLSTTYKDLHTYVV